MRFAILKLKAVLHQEQNHHTCIALGIFVAGSESWDYLRLILRGSDSKLVSCLIPCLVRRTYMGYIISHTLRYKCKCPTPTQTHTPQHYLSVGLKQHWQLGSQLAVGITTGSKRCSKWWGLHTVTFSYSDIRVVNSSRAGDCILWPFHTVIFVPAFANTVISIHVHSVHNITYRALQNLSCVHLGSQCRRSLYYKPCTLTWAQRNRQVAKPSGSASSLVCRKASPC